MALKLSDRLLLWRLRIAGRRITQPSCRVCGYPVKGLTGPTCPECGADRAVVGVIEPLPSLQFPLIFILAAWWTLVIAIAWISWPLTSELLPRDVSYNEDYTLTPHSHLYGPFKIRRIGYGTGWKAIGPWPTHVHGATTWENTLDAFGGRFLTVVDVNPRQSPGPYNVDASYAITRYDGRDLKGATALPPQMGKMNGEFVLGWLGRMEIDTSRADVRAEADEIAALMLAPEFRPEVYLALKQFDVKVNAQKSASSSPTKWSLPVIPAVWLVVGLAGSVALSRRNRRRRPDAAKPAVLV